MNIITTRLIASSNSLSPRQLESLAWTAEGKSYEETATIIGCRAETVRKHVRLAGQKLMAYGNKESVICAAFCDGTLRPIKPPVKILFRIESSIPKRLRIRARAKLLIKKMKAKLWLKFPYRKPFRSMKTCSQMSQNGPPMKSV